MLALYPFHATAFVLPPWERIYSNDTKRDQSFAEAVTIHERVVGWYSSCGYVLNEVPCAPIARRVEHVLDVLAAGAA